MTYEQALDIIHSLDKFGSRPGLDRIKMLFDMLSPDLLKQNFIHVAGTNGKGSVCQMISRVLTQSGHKTGLFISPYITDFCERIQINNEMVKREELCNAVEHLFPMVEKLNEQGIIITEFEFLTALAFYIYKQNNCDIIVCETGLGGLLDSTNLIEKPLCSVLTKIDLDHTAILGDTVEEIAVQKCGIIKENSITITSLQSNSVNEIISNTSNEKNNKLYHSENVEFENVELSLNGTKFTFNGTEITLPLCGEHQVENAKVAIATLNALKENGYVNFTDSELKDGLSKATNPARFELLSDSPVVVLDGAHNTNGMTAFKNATQRFVGEKRALLVGMLKDKDVNDALALIKGMFDIVVVTDVPNPRNLDCYELADICKKYFEKVVVCSNPKNAFDTAYKIACDNECSLLVCGSLYLAGELRPHIIESLKK